MRALFAGGGELPHFRDIPEPHLENGLDALVEPVAVALCDLDVPLIQNHLPSAAPYPVGHEFTARVKSVGESVIRFRAGDLVTVPFQISCGMCKRCHTRRQLDCLSVPALSTFGLAPFGGGAWGGAACDLVRVPFADAMLLLLPDSVDPIALASVSDNVADG
jgi:threonine dehydrogenase-like Zn-dependent dehydrogenase